MNKFYNSRHDTSDASKFRSWKQRRQKHFFFSSCKDVSDFSNVNSFAEEGRVETRLRQPGGPGSSHVYLVTLTFDRILIAGLSLAFLERRVCFCLAFNLNYRRRSRYFAIFFLFCDFFVPCIPGTLVF